MIPTGEEFIDRTMEDGSASVTASDRSPDSMSSPRPWDIFFRLAPWLGVLGLAAWTRWPSFPLLVFAGGASVAALAARPRGGRARALSSAIVLAGALAGSFGHVAMRRISQDFGTYWDARSDRAEEALHERLDGLLTMGEEAVARIGDLASRGTNTAVLNGLRDVREETGMTLATIYGSEGEFRLWEGVHRGVVPAELRMGEVRYLYRDRPLFSYLYFTAPIPGGGTAMAAALIKANLPRNLEENPGDFVTDFRDTVGEDLRIFRAERTSGEDVFDLRWEDEALFSVAVVRPTQEQRLRDVRSTWSRVVGLMAVIAWLVLAFTAGTDKSDRAAAALTPLGLALLAPVGVAMGSAPFFTAADFVLPGPVPVSFERVLLVGVALAVVLAAHMPPALRRGSLASGLAVLIGFPLLSVLILGGAGPVLLAGTEGRWIVYQMGLALVLTLVCLGAFRLGERTDGEARPQIPITLAIGALVGLWLAGAFWVRMAGTIPGWVTGAWALPALLAAFGLACVQRGASRLDGVVRSGGDRVLGGRRDQLGSPDRRADGRGRASIIAPGCPRGSVPRVRASPLRGCGRFTGCIRCGVGGASLRELDSERVGRGGKRCVAHALVGRRPSRIRDHDRCGRGTSRHRRQFPRGGPPG